MTLMIVLGLAFLGLAIPLIALFYFANKREKQDQATRNKGRRG